MTIDFSEQHIELTGAQCQFGSNSSGIFSSSAFSQIVYLSSKPLELYEICSLPPDHVQPYPWPDLLRPILPRSN